MSTYAKLSIFGLLMIILMLLWLPANVLAGDLDSPSAPGATSSYTLEDIYNRLDAGMAGSQSTFTEPAAGPTTGTMHTLNDIMGKAPAKDAANGAGAGDVLHGKTFWGLTEGAWGLQTGSLTTQTPDNTTVSQPAGYYDAFNLSTVDANLATGNIRSGVTVFGVAGDGNVVNTSSGDASAGDMLLGKKAWVDGAEVTGSATAGTDVSGADGSKTFTIPDGLYSGNKTATANDSNLATGNIASGVQIFGVTGTAVVASGDATAGDVLAGKTFSNAGGSGIAGTMVNKGAGGTITPGTSDQTIGAGYWSSANVVSGDADLTAGNIRKGKAIFGVDGALAPGALAKRVAKTGQTQCWDSEGNLIACAHTGQDGEYQMGIDAAITPTGGQTGAYNTPAWTGERFTDNGDGTVTDNLTALVWLKDSSCFGHITWANALSSCNGLASGSCGLSDGSTAGQWRLPNVNELHSLIDLTQRNPALPNGHPFIGNLSSHYWSSSTYADYPGYAWGVYFSEGHVDHNVLKINRNYVRCVRGGQ